MKRILIKLLIALAIYTFAGIVVVSLNNPERWQVFLLGVTWHGVVSILFAIVDKRRANKIEIEVVYQSLNELKAQTGLDWEIQALEGYDDDRLN